MATKTKLEQAVERQADSLSEAQKELALSQCAAYKRNRDRISQLEGKIAAIDACPYHTMDEMRVKQAERSSLAYERAQLMAANSRIAFELSELLKG